MPVTINGTSGITTPGLDASGTNKFATTIGVGNATPAASGAGITFPATQSNSSDANTLDDYEEGTWTPVTPVSYSGGGTYQKIGNTVFLNTFINVGSNSNNSSFIITGLPYPLINQSSSVGCFSNTSTDLYAYMDGNGIYIRTNGNADRTCASLSGSFVAFQMYYRT